MLRAARLLALVASLVGAPGCGHDDGAAAGPAQAPPVAATTAYADAPLERPQTGDAKRAAPIVRQAILLAQAQRPLEATRAFEDALAIDPASLAGRIAYGYFLLETLDPTDSFEALREFRLALLIQPSEPIAACGEAIARAYVGDDVKAEPLLIAAIANDVVKRAPQLALAQAALARIRAVEGRNDEALQLYESAAAEPGAPSRNRADWMVRRADILAQLDRFADAETVVRQALVRDPEEVQGHYLLSQLLAKRGATEESKREAHLHELLRQLYDHQTKRLEDDTELRLSLRRQIVAADPHNLRAAYQMVRELLGCSHWSEALEQTEALMKRDGATSELHWLAARAKAGAGDLVGAKADADAMRQLKADVPADVLRAILDDWRKGNPAVTTEQVRQKFMEWTGQ